MKNKGFTLIELVIVIVILGILAVTAAPKFLNLQSDARKSVLQGMAGSIKDANDLVYSKAAINGIEEEAQITAESFGYPDAWLKYGQMGADQVTLETFVQGFDGDDWEFVDLGATNRIQVQLVDTRDICYILYYDAMTDPQGQSLLPARTEIFDADC